VVYDYFIATFILGLGYTESDSYLVKAIREITDTMLAINAAVNFVIYVVFNRGFRDRLTSQLYCRPAPSSFETSLYFSRLSLSRGRR